MKNAQHNSTADICDFPLIWCIIQTKGGMTMRKHKKRCRAFDLRDPVLQYRHLKNLVPVERYGSFCGENMLFTWDDGYRMLSRCPECDALVLIQHSEYHGANDSYYSDYFAVDSVEEAHMLNKKYNGWDIETKYKDERIYL